MKIANVPLRFSTSILTRLGEELNPSPDQSIMELVKNSYDADAVECSIELMNVDAPGGTILIRDNGDGMDADAIRQGWLVIGKSLKQHAVRTRLGRIPAGSKGLGRLAALRMGSAVTLTSRPRQNPRREFRLSIDWARYDQVAVVEDVLWSITEASAPSDAVSGTEISIQNVGRTVSKTETRRLARAVLLLADPFGQDPAAFRPVLRVPEFAEMEELVKNRYFRDAEYHLSATVDKVGHASAGVTDWRGEELFSAGHKELAKTKPSRYACPPARFDLWVFILDKASFSTRSSTLDEVREWLKVFGGVHLYQNGLRVNPYGNPGNDWLEMNLRRAKSPEERPSTNTSIGRVSLSDTDELLVQKTDRSGFIESDTFFELKRFAADALDWMAKRRLELAEKRRARERVEAPRRSQSARRTIEEAIGKSPKAARPALEQAFRVYHHAREKEVRELQREVQLYRTLSTAGITAATFAHEATGNPIKTISTSIQTIKRRCQQYLGSNFEKVATPIDLVKQATDAMRVLGGVTLSLVDHEKRRSGRVDLHRVIGDTLGIFSPFLANRNVTIRREFADASPFLKGTEAAIESIITNFLNNSLVALESVRADGRLIVIGTHVDGTMLRMRVLDNGPGIEGISRQDVWLPGQTTRRNGTGLGLTIVRDAVRDLGGTVDVLEHGELGGAEFIVDLPIIGA